MVLRLKICNEIEWYYQGEVMFRKSNKPKRKRTAAFNIADEFEREKHKKELDKFLNNSMKMELQKNL